MTEAPVRRGISRRQFIGATGLAGLAAWAVTGRGAASADTSGQRGPATREIPFDRAWLFGPAAAGSSAPEFDDSGLATVTLPHTVVPLSWRNWDPAAWERHWVYRKHFDAPGQFDGMRVFLDVDAAMTGATATLNGRTVADHLGGYLPFGGEVTGLLQQRDNVLAVTLDSTFQLDVPPDRPAPAASTSVDFWQPGGIYRDVRLRAVPFAFVADVFAKPVDVLDATKRAVQVQCTVDAASVPPAPCSIVVDLLDGDRKVASATTPISVQQGQTTVTATLTGLSDVALWDIDDPRLYTIVATLSVGGTALHDYQVRIGFREARFALDGFYLNGRRRKLFGLNRHQFFPFAGAAMPARVQRRDAEILRRELNCNMVRCSHYPQAEAFYDACDELGLMAWEEAPGWGYLGDDTWKERAYRDVGDMVRRDRNHPSIIIWGARLNETPDDVAFYTRTRDLAHELDGSRPTVGAMAGRHNTTQYVQDVFSQNDYSSSTDAYGDKQPELMPPRTDRPYMVSETVGTLSGPARYYRRTDDQPVQQGQATAHARVHDIGASDDRYCGVLPWSGFDYDSGSGNQYQGVKYTGVVDLFRVPKPGAAIYQAQLDPSVRPVIAPAFYWDFGPTSPVNGLRRAMICSNCDRLELLVGGDHFATLQPDTAQYPHLAYAPSFADFSGVGASARPELRIDGYVGGTKVASRSFSADTNSDYLALRADDTELIGDGVDTTRVEFRAVDRFGAPRPYVTGDVTFSVAGPAVLLGDNPFAFGDTGGVGAVWLRTLPDSPGTVTLRAHHGTLGDAEVQLRVQQSTPGGTPAPYGSLSVAADPAIVPPGTATEVAAGFTNQGSPTLQSVSMTIAVPDGWTSKALTPTTFSGVASGETVSARWQLTAADDAPPGTVDAPVTATYATASQRGVATADAMLLVPYASLAKAYNNTGISDDDNVDSADLDGVGNSYSQQALDAAGLAPGAVVTHDGVRFVWPQVPAGQPDNAVAEGQVIRFDGSGSTLGFLGCGSPGDEGGTGTVHYTDGTSDDFTVTLDNYFYPPDGNNNDTLVALPYLNSKGTGGRPRGQRTVTVYVYYTGVPLSPGKTVRAITLPAGGSTPATGRISGMHVFAIGIG